MTGQELYELLQERAPGFFWARWDALQDGLQDAFTSASMELRQRERERVYEATAGEDI